MSTTLDDNDYDDEEEDDGDVGGRRDRSTERVADRDGRAGGGGDGRNHPLCTNCDDDETEEMNCPMTVETRRAIDAVKFIAAHLKNEDDYAEVCSARCKDRGSGPFVVG